MSLLEVTTVPWRVGAFLGAHSGKREEQEGLAALGSICPLVYGHIINYSSGV